jgi:hypothetical protein
MINAVQDWADRSRMQINTEKTEVMAFFETPAMKAARTSATFVITFRFPASKPPRHIQLKEPPTFTYLGLQLDPILSMFAAANHMVSKINWAHLTIAAVAHSLHHDTPLRLQHCRSSPLLLFRLWQSCVLPFATTNLRYLTNNAQIDKVQSALISSLTRTLRCYAPPQILMVELGIPPLKLQQAAQLVGIHFRYTVTHTHLIAAKLYTLRGSKRCSNRHPPASMENRIAAAHQLLHLSHQYPGPPPLPHPVQQAKQANKCKSYARYLKKHVNQEWYRQLRSAHPPAYFSQDPISRTQAYIHTFLPPTLPFMHKLPLYLSSFTESNTISILRFRTQCHELIPTHSPDISTSRRDDYASRLCNYCSNQETGSELHIFLDCPYTKHISTQIISTLTDLLDTMQLAAWNTLSRTQQLSLILGTPPADLLQKKHEAWIKITLPHSLRYVSDIQKLLYST